MGITRILSMFGFLGGLIFASANISGSATEATNNTLSPTIRQVEATTTVLDQTTIPLSPTTTEVVIDEPVVVTEQAVRVEEPTTTTTSPPVPAYRGRVDQVCPQWMDLARSVGWPEEELSKLSYIIYRESRCQPEAWNQDDPTPDGSRGLTQINGFWCRPSKYNPDGYLQTFHPGLLPNGVCSDLHDPEVNLRAAKALYDYGVERGNNPWTPWGG